MTRLWDCLMYAGEADMLAMHLEETERRVHRWVIAQAKVTHRGLPKPLHDITSDERFAAWRSRLVPVTANLDGLPAPWQREHAQRDAAWSALTSEGLRDDDVVLIADADEIPSAAALAWSGPDAVSLFMRTALFAVDWEVAPSHPLPPSAVMCTGRLLRDRGGSLAAVRDGRGVYPILRDGGWHFSWVGGPAFQREKLEKRTCHTEIYATPEGTLIRSGARWRSPETGGGIPVEPAEVDETWPAFIRERRCPADWFRPRSGE